MMDDACWDLLDEILAEGGAGGVGRDAFSHGLGGSATVTQLALDHVLTTLCTRTAGWEDPERALHKAAPAQPHPACAVPSAAAPPNQHAIPGPPSPGMPLSCRSSCTQELALAVAPFAAAMSWQEQTVPAAAAAAVCMSAAAVQVPGAHFPAIAKQAAAQPGPAAPPLQLQQIHQQQQWDSMWQQQQQQQDGMQRAAGAADFDDLEWLDALWPAGELDATQAPSLLADAAQQPGPATTPAVPPAAAQLGRAWSLPAAVAPPHAALQQLECVNGDDASEALSLAYAEAQAQLSLEQERERARLLAQLAPPLPLAPEPLSHCAGMELPPLPLLPSLEQQQQQQQQQQQKQAVQRPAIGSSGSAAGGSSSGDAPPLSAFAAAAQAPREEEWGSGSRKASGGLCREAGKLPLRRQHSEHYRAGAPRVGAPRQYNITVRKASAVPLKHAATLPCRRTCWGIHGVWRCACCVCFASCAGRMLSCAQGPLSCLLPPCSLQPGPQRAQRQDRLGDPAACPASAQHQLGRAGSGRLAPLEERLMRLGGC